MRKNLQILFAVSLLIINFDIFSHASTDTKKENKYKWEFSTSASLDINKVKYNGDSDTRTTFSIPVRIGYFITKNIEIEPEINYMHTTFYPTYGGKQSDSEALFLVNFAFNFRASSRVTPFILGGVGAFREKEESQIEPFDTWYETHFVKNAGAGLKWFAANRIALRIEYRFIFYNDGNNNITHHKIYIGISIFL